MARKLNRNRKHLSAVLIILMGIIIGTGIYFFVRPNKPNTVIPSTSPQSTTTQSVGNKQQSVVGSQPNGSDSSKNGDAASSSAVLLSPSGTFVSNHHPNLSGSPAPSKEQSVCNSTPGASCYVKFTTGAVTKTLSSQTVDANGSAYWYWDVDSAGFTPGSWQITAVATLNGQTKSTNDTLDLVVQQ